MGSLHLSYLCHVFSDLLCFLQAKIQKNPNFNILIFVLMDSTMTHRFSIFKIKFKWLNIIFYT